MYPQWPGTCPGPCPYYARHPGPSRLRPFLGGGCSRLDTLPPTSQAFSCIDQNRDGIICKSDLRETYSQLGEHLPLLPTLGLLSPGLLGQRDSTAH